MGLKKAAVLVAGSWGTALAFVLAENGYEVTLWTRNPAQAEEINSRHTNSRFLTDIVLPESLRATTRMEEAVRGAAAVIVAATSASMREIASQLNPHLDENTLLIHATKGLETGTLKRMSIVLAEELPNYNPARIVVLSGPSHAEEVVMKCPTTVVVAAEHHHAADAAQDLLINSFFRVYTNPDVLGVEMGGALKNIIALGAGMTDGLGFGDNAKAALMTRGLAEISRLGIAMGANPLTFAGLAGVGDLIVTCTSQHSRNWKAGYLLGKGAPLQEVLDKMGMVVEGVKTTQAASALARQYQVPMPITEAIFQVLFDGKSAEQAVAELMGRVKTNEIEEIAQGSAAKWLE